MFNFDTRKTSVSRALKISSFPLFAYASFLSQLFFYLFIIALILIPFSFLGFILFITTPIIIIQSHLAMENIAPLPFIILWLIGVFKYNQTRKVFYLVVMAISLILSFNSYLGMRLIMPVLFLLSCAFILYKNRKGLHTGQPL